MAEGLKIFPIKPDHNHSLTLTQCCESLSQNTTIKKFNYTVVIKLNVELQDQIFR